MRHPSHARTRPDRRALPCWGNLFPIKRLQQRSLLPAPTSLISTASEARLGKASASVPPCQGCKRAGAEPQEKLPSAGWGPGPSIPGWAATCIPPPTLVWGSARVAVPGQGLKSPNPAPRVLLAVRGPEEGCPPHPLPLLALAQRRAATAFSSPLKIGLMAEQQCRRAGSPDPKPACVTMTN